MLFTQYKTTCLLLSVVNAGAVPEGGDRPPKTYESNDVHHDFLQFGKQHSQYKQNRRQKVVNRGALRLCGVALRSFVQGWA